jgi:hypothetical protein
MRMPLISLLPTTRFVGFFFFFLILKVCQKKSWKNFYIWYEPIISSNRLLGVKTIIDFQRESCKKLYTEGDSLGKSTEIN